MLELFTNANMSQDGEDTQKMHRGVGTMVRWLSSV